MSDAHTQDVLDRLFRLDIGPIEAADELIASGQFMVGSASAYEPFERSEQTLRLQALLGRLAWVILQRGGAAELPPCVTIEEYRDFYLRTLESAEEDT